MEFYDESYERDGASEARTEGFIQQLHNKQFKAQKLRKVYQSGSETKYSAYVVQLMQLT